MKIIVTGSARLDVFKNLGDPLAGRYFMHHLLPISIAELKQLNLPVNLEKLMIQSGFPEPFLQDNVVEAKRWRMQYTNSLLSSELFDFENVKNLSALQTIMKLLQRKVGSPVSYKSIADDVGIAPATVKKYIQILEALYVVFQVTPYSKNIARSLLKEPKIYFYDTGLVVGDTDAKFENFMAVSLLKHAYAKTDYEAEETTLHLWCMPQQNDAGDQPPFSTPFQSPSI